MISLHIAELRGSWRAWASVSLAFIATGFALSIGSIVIAASNQALQAGRLDDTGAVGLIAIAGMNLFVGILVGIGVLSSSAQLVINSRRPAIARLALAGASPVQIRNTLSSQLFVVSLVCSVIGALIAIAVQIPVFDALISGADGFVGQPLHFTVPIPALLAAITGVVLVALLAGVPVATRATRIPPVEALRQASMEPDEKVKTSTKVVFGIFVAVILVISAASYYAFSLNDLQKGDQITMIGILVLVLSGLAMQRGAAVLMRPLTKAWTSLVRTSSPAWHLARHTVLARSTRLVRTVVPIMFAVGLSTGLITMVSMFNVIIERKYGPGESTDSVSGLILLVGLGFLISLAGGVGNLLMMGRQRDAELALAGISGATEDQQRGMVAFEGLIVGVTATILGLIMCAYTTLYVVVAFYIYAEPTFATDWLALIVVVSGALVLAVVATAGPSLPTLRQPPQKVVARLIAD